MKLKINLILVAIMLILASICAEQEGYTALDELQCGTLIQTCGDDEDTIMRGVKDLSQNVDEQTRYWRVWDCAMDEWVQDECDAACTVQIH